MTNHEQQQNGRRRRRMPWWGFILIATALIGVIAGTNQITAQNLNIDKRYLPNGSVAVSVCDNNQTHFGVGIDVCTNSTLFPQAFYVNGGINATTTSYINNSQICTGSNGICGSVTGINISKDASSAAVNITPSAIFTSGTFTMQFPEATTTQTGFATGTQITSLNLKALAGSCSGWNSTHINVTMNATTAGVQCFPVQFNQTGGGATLSGGLAGLPAVWSSTTAIIAYGINSSHINTTGPGSNNLCLGFGTGTQLAWVPCSNSTTGAIATLTSEVNNSGTTQTSLFNTTIPASLLGNDGDTVAFELSGYTSGCTATVSCDLAVYLNTTKVFDSNGVVLSADQNWNLWGTVQRKSITTAVVSTRLGSSGAMTWNYNNITRSDLAINWNSPVIINFTAVTSGVGSGSNQIIARSGFVQKGGAANGTATYINQSGGNITTTSLVANQFVYATNGTNIVSTQHIQYQNSSQFIINATQNFTFNGTVSRYANNCSFIGNSSGLYWTC